MKKSIRASMATAFVGLVLAASSYANEIVVPGDYATIQDALNAASQGDEIRVLPGTYFENIKFPNADVRLFSDLGPEVTFIDGGGSGRVVRIIGGQSRATVLEGFTIRNGQLGQYDVCGAGIGIIQSSPTIRRNRIESSHAECGGGIGIRGGSALIIDNEITGNTTSGTGRAGGLFVGDDSTAEIRRNDISNNIGDGAHADGTTATFIQNVFQQNFGESGAEAAFSAARFIENQFIGNTSTDWGGGLYIRGAGTVLVRRNLFQDNSALHGGGAIWCFSGGIPVIEQNRFVNNSLHAIGLLNSSDPIIESNLFVGNEVAIDYEASPVGPGIQIRGNTFYDNSGVNGTAIEGDGSDGEAVISNNIFFEPDGQVPVWIGDSFNPDLPEIRNNCVYANGSVGWGGVLSDLTGVDGNISTDPGFVDATGGDFGLLSNSPCLDSGEPTWLPLGLDLAGAPRITDGNLDGSMVADMGAFELNNIRLEATGDFTPGGQITLAATGTDRGIALLISSAPQSPVIINPFGPIFLDRSGAWQLLAVGSLPLTAQHTLPNPGSAPVAYQAALRFGTVGGNLSNPLIFGDE